MFDDLEAIKDGLVMVGAGAAIYFFAVGLAARRSRTRFERGCGADGVKTREEAGTGNGAPNALETGASWPGDGK